ncbi:MAG: chorismate synthase [Candidatus Hydrogenedentes bacterium]|nr:chorismate synthase [Candidatus Hydrogenedentota bacterium]
MNIVIMGPKGAGKSTVGAALAELLGVPIADTDALIEARYAAAHGIRKSCRGIFREDGEAVFRQLEREAAQEAARMDYHIVITGGGLMMDPESRRALRTRAVLVYLYAEPDVLWARAASSGVPPWLEGDDGPARFAVQVAQREEVLLPFADALLDTSEDEPAALAEKLAEEIGRELSVRERGANTYGDVLRMTCFGESHGKAIGVVVDGMRPGVPYSEGVIQHQLDRRRPGQSKVVTQRKEPDEVAILSGVFEGKTTGAPIAMVIYNQDQRSKNYDNIKDVFRPGHGDFTFYSKYGFRDYRGGGRQSGRETACRVAAGAVPMDLLLQRGVRVVAHATEVAGITAKTCDFEVIEENVVRCADMEAAKLMEEAILAARSDRDSVGGIVQLEVHGLPPGLGDPIFGKLDARLIQGIMTIGAFKGVEVGGGFALTKLRGSEANDPMEDGKFLSNHHGGILGGISTGAPVIMRVAVKPTASIAQKQRTTDEHGKNVEIEVLGRHDPCIVPRAVPVIENMAAFVILDAWEVQMRLNPEWAEKHPLYPAGA